MTDKKFLWLEFSRWHQVWLSALIVSDFETMATALSIADRYWTAMMTED